VGKAGKRRFGRGKTWRGAAWRPAARQLPLRPRFRGTFHTLRLTHRSQTRSASMARAHSWRHAAHRAKGAL